MEKYIITINAETAKELKQAILDLAKTFDPGEVITSVKVDAEDTEPIEVVAKNVKKETPKEEPVVSPTEETFKDVSEDVVSLEDAKPIITAFGMKSKENQAFVKKFLDEKGVIRLSDLNDADRTELVKLVSADA